MGLLVDGVWQEDASRTKDGHFIRPTTAFRNWVTPDGSAGPSGEGGFAAEARPLSPLCLARLPVGAPHPHLPQAQGAGGRDLDVDRLAGHASRTAGPSTTTTGSTRRHRQRQEQTVAKSICSPTRTTPAASACRCCGTRSARPSSTTNSSEIIRMLNSAFDALHQCAHRLLSAGVARRDRRAQRARLSEHQQRRLSRRLRHHAGGLRGGVPRICSTRSTRSSSVLSRAALSRRRRHHRSRLAAVHDADPFRRGLLRALQMQLAAHLRISRTCRIICAIFIRCRASPRPSASSRSSGTITAASAR